MKKVLLTTIIMLFSVLTIQSQKQKNKKENLLVKLQEGVKPLIYVDGRIFDFPMELIDQSKIESVFVFKNKEALKKYNAPNGVVIIKTKGSNQKNISADRKIGGKNAPKVIIDGKVTDKKDFEKLTPDKIENMQVIKGEKALKKYNAPNGVIIITTKKKKGN